MKKMIAAAVMLIMGQKAGAVGVIGGADGPTAIIVSSAPDAWMYAVAAAALLAAGIVFAVRRKRK